MDYPSRNQYSLMPNDLYISSPRHPHSYHSSGIIGEQSPTAVAGDGQFFLKLLKEGGGGGFGSFPDNGKPGGMRPPQDWDPAFGSPNGVLNWDLIDRGGGVYHSTLDPRWSSTFLDSRGGMGGAHPPPPLFPSVEAFQVPSTHPLAFLPSQGAFPCTRETSEGPWPFLDLDLRQVRADQWTQSAGNTDFHPPKEANLMVPPFREHYPIRPPNLGYCPVETNSFNLGMHNQVLPPPPTWFSPSSSNMEEEKGHGRSSQDWELYFATRQAAMHAIEKPLSTQEGGSMPKFTVTSAFPTVPNQRRSKYLGVPNPFPSDKSLESKKGIEESKDTEEDELLKEVMMNGLGDLDISETPTDPPPKHKEDLRKGRSARIWHSRQNQTTISLSISDYHGEKVNVPFQVERGMSLQLGHPERNSEQSQQQLYYADSNGQGVEKEGGIQEAFSAISHDRHENGREESKETVLKTRILHSKKHPHADQRQGMIGHPVGGLSGMDATHLEKLTMQLLSLVESLAPHEDEKKKRQALLSCLGNIIAHDFPGGRLFLFGSCANDFGVSNSDIDICLAIGDERSNKAELVTKLARILEANQMLNLQALTHARVPIVKFTDPTTSISCDICINNMLAVVNTRLLHDYAQIDDRLRQLAFVVKHWAKRRQVNETYRGTLSSYAYVLMCIHFLQQRKPPILPCLQEMEPTYKVTVGKRQCAYYDRVDTLTKFGSKNKESLGELSASFFEYWGFQHDYTRAVISVRTGGFLSKIEKEWTRRIGNERHLICIEDPFETSHDLGRVVDKHSIRFLRDEFQRAARIVRHDPNPCITLFFDP